MCSAWLSMPVRIEPVSTSISPTTSGLSPRMNSVMPVSTLRLLRRYPAPGSGRWKAGPVPVA